MCDILYQCGGLQVETKVNQEQCHTLGGAGLNHMYVSADSFPCSAVQAHLVVQTQPRASYRPHTTPDDLCSCRPPPPARILLAQSSSEALRSDWGQFCLGVSRG